MADAPPAAPLAGAVDEPSPRALARLGALLPGVDGLVRFAYRTAAVSALSVAAIVAAAGEAVGWNEVTGLPLAVGAAVLLVPAAAAALAGWTLADLVSIPGQLRAAALRATGRTASVAPKGSRLLRVVRSLWVARGLALTSKGAWLRGVGALRFLRLASLPFALALVGMFALNGVVIVAGVVAVLLLLF